MFYLKMKVLNCFRKECFKEIFLKMLLSI